MSGDYGRELGLLRSLVGAVEFRPPIPSQQFNQSYLQAERIAVAQAVNGGVITVRAPAGKSFEELCGCVVGRSPRMERGTEFTEVRTQVLKELRSFVGRASSSITLDEAASFQARLDDWFSSRVAVRRIFVPCFISPWRAPRFDIGPAQFVFAADATKTDLYPAADDLISKDGFDRLLDLAKANKADWLACVTIDGCERERAEALGGLAVDLAIVGLQLSIPLAFGTRTMGRLDARRGAAERRTLSETNGYYNAGWARMDAGSSIGVGTLADMLRNAAPIIAAVGARVQGFATGQFKLEALERAWCDAAYWLHEALAEPTDAIAVAKLETTLEVLLRAESASGSRRRVETMLRTFYGLSPGDPITAGTSTTARQFADSFVGDRSRILHGTWSTLNSRLALGRPGLEGFVIAVIRRAAIELEVYASSPDPSDDIDAFMTWVREKSPVPKVPS